MACQISAAYSLMVRSLEKRLEQATLMIARMDHVVRIGVESRHTTLSFQVRVEIGQVHIVITAMQKHLPDRLENPRLIAAKMVIED